MALVKRQAWLAPFFLFALILLGYVRTLQPTFGWGDSSELATAMRFLGIGHSPGYPTFMMLGHAFTWLPLGEFAYRVNLFNATCGAIAAVLVYLICHHLTKSRLASFAAAGCFAFSATFWDATTEVDVHTLHACFVAGFIYALVRWREGHEERFLSWAAIMLGLGLTNHPLIGLLTPAAIYLIVAEKGWRFLASPPRLLRCAGLVVLALSLYLYLPIRGAHNPPPAVSNPHTLREVMMQITAPGCREFMFHTPVGAVVQKIASYPLRLLREVGYPGIAAGLMGLAVLWRRDRRFLVFALLAMATTTFYAANYSIFDIYQYYIQTYLVWALLMAFGFMAIIQFVRWATDRKKPVGGLRQGALAGMVLLTFPLVQFSANLARVDASDDYSASDYAHAALAEVEPNSLVLADWWAVAPLGYLKYVEGIRKDVTLSPAFSLSSDKERDRLLDRKYLQRYPAVYAREIITALTGASPELRERYQLVQEGPLLRVVVDPPDPRSLEVESSASPKALFGQSLRLLETETKPARVQEGDSLHVDYVWTTTGRLPKLDTFTRIRDADGQAVSVDKSAILQGLYPVERWEPGQAVRERHSIYLESGLAPGQYVVTLKVKEREGKRAVLACPQGEDSYQGEFVVGRFELKARTRGARTATAARVASGGGVSVRGSSAG